MLNIREYTLSFLIVAAPTLAEPILLHYQPDQPVIQHSHVTIELSHKATKQSKIYQDAEAELTLLPSASEPPYQMTLTLNKLRVGLEEGSRKVSFDSASPKNSPFLNQLADIIGDPIQVTLGENLQIQRSSANYQRLIKDLKPLNGFNITSLFSEMFQQMFALANKPLEVDQTYTRELRLGAQTNAPVLLTYRIVGITPDEVRAIIDGTVPETTFQLAQSTSDPLTVKAKGLITGKAVWSRANALVYRTKINSVYDGVIVDNEMERPFELHMEHRDSSARIPQGT